MIAALAAAAQSVSRTVPPAGFTWRDATADMPGGWERARAGIPTQGMPIAADAPPTTTAAPDTTDHRTEDAARQAVIRQGLERDRGMVAYDVTVPSAQAFTAALAAGGLTEEEVRYVGEYRAAHPDNMIDSQLSAGVVDGVYSWSVSDALALQLHDQGANPRDWYAAQWVASTLDSRKKTAAEVAVKQAAEEAAKTPVLPKPLMPLPTTSTAPSKKTVALVALAAGVGYLLLS